MSQEINSLLQQYILWPELKNDYQDNIHFGNTSLHDFYKEIKHLIENFHLIDTKIATFYVANEMVSDIRKESEDVLTIEDLNKYNTYQKILNSLSKELITYILVCSIVEARHNDDFINMKRIFKNEFLPNEILKEEYSDDKIESLMSFSESLNSLKNTSDIIENLHTQPVGQQFLKSRFGYRENESEEEFFKFLNFKVLIRENIKKLLHFQDEEEEGRNNGYTNVGHNVFNLLKDYNLEECLHNLVRLFSTSRFCDGYGGMPWAGIAKHGLDFVRGEINAEMFIDQAFSLEHNNGNMFNKDFLFKRTGSIPLVFHSAYYTLHKHETIFETSTLLLNSQHLGLLSNLCSLEPFIEYMKKLNLNDIDMDNMSHLLKEISSNNNFNQYDDNEFATHINTAQHMVENINYSLRHIKLDWKNNYPDIYDFIQQKKAKNNYIPLDFKKLFYEISSRNLDKSHDHHEIYQDLFYATNSKENEHLNGGYFDLLNELYNRIFKEKKLLLHFDNNKENNFNIVKPFSPSIYSLEQIQDNLFDKNLLGGKAWGLVNMKNMGLPVPKAKIFTTECSYAYFHHIDKFLHFIKENLSDILLFLTDENNNPRLCSIRSGAPVSMPGMMDTVLNVGIDDSNYEYFCDILGKNVTDNCVNKFMELFCSSRLDTKVHFNGDIEKTLMQFKKLLISHNKNYDAYSMFPLNKEQQIEESLYAVFNSWDSDRATAYRIEKGISHELGTAAIIQEMVFGNLNENSCTGVVFSRNCLTGENQLVGEFLPNAQGEDVVSGTRTPYDISKLKFSQPDIYQQLENIAKKLELATGYIQDIEFTVEDGKLYILQHRQAVCSPVAAIELLEDKTLNQDVILSHITPKSLQNNFIVDTQEEVLVSGLSANSGVLQGMIITSAEDLTNEDIQQKYNDLKSKNPQLGLIFYAQLTSPEHMPIMNKTDGFITEQGGFTSHAAIIARSLNKPCIVGLSDNDLNKSKYNIHNIKNDMSALFCTGDIITMDGESGHIWIGEQPLIKSSLSHTATETILNSANINLDFINLEDIVQEVNKINHNNKAWMFNFENTHVVNQSPVKTNKFFDLSLKVALIITANHKNNHKQKNLNLSL